MKNVLILICILLTSNLLAKTNTLFQLAEKCTNRANELAISAYLLNNPSVETDDIHAYAGNPMVGKEFNMNDGEARFYVVLTPEESTSGEPVASIDVIVDINNCKLEGLMMNRWLYKEGTDGQDLGSNFDKIFPRNWKMYEKQ